MEPLTSKVRDFLCWVISLSLLGACTSAPGHATQVDPMEAHFHLRAADSSHQPARGWVVLLPGASGLKIFDDDQHYFRTAHAVNSMGFDAVVIDYKAAYRAAQAKPDGSTGEKIVWVVERAIESLRSRGIIRNDEPGAIIAWSLGAEGMWPLLDSQDRARRLGVRCVALYYPSNEEHVPLRTNLPLLILTGSADDVTPPKPIRASVDQAASALITLKVYEGARHGFDIQSLAKPRTVELIPFIGPRATFGHDPSADADARRLLEELLVSALGGGTSPTQ